MNLRGKFTMKNQWIRNPRQRPLAVLLVCAALSLPAISALAAVYTVENGSMALNGAAINGWDSSSAEARDNGPFRGAVSHQAIDSPSDPNPGSGSLVFTAAGTGACSLSQETLITANGQEVSLSADVARDDAWSAGQLIFGFYDSTSWDCLAGCTINLAPLVTPDTDGTLDTFTPVSVTATLPTSGATVRIIIGTSCDTYFSPPAGAKFAIDNVRPDPPTAVEDWMLF